MAATLAQVTADALTLPSEEQERLLDLLVESIASKEGGAPLGANWDEVKRRIEEIGNGVETISVEEVFAKSREKRG